MIETCWQLMWILWNCEFIKINVHAIPAWVKLRTLTIMLNDQTRTSLSSFGDKICGFNFEITQWNEKETNSTQTMPPTMVDLCLGRALAIVITVQHEGSCN